MSLHKTWPAEVQIPPRKTQKYLFHVPRTKIHRNFDRIAVDFLYIDMLYLYGYVTLSLTNRLAMAARKMKGPLCGSEMEVGPLRSRGGVFFLPHGEKMPEFYII